MCVFVLELHATYKRHELTSETQGCQAKPASTTLVFESERATAAEQHSNDLFFWIVFGFVLTSEL